MRMPKQKPFVFVLMPFHENFKDIYKFGIRGAAEEVGAYAERVDEQFFQEGILDRIFNQISKADVIVADMTGKNPNVFYEVGYAHALGKTVVLLTQNTDDIPFDLKHRRHIVYEGSIDNLRAKLIEELKWAINQVRIDAQSSVQFDGISQSLDLEIRSYKIYPTPIGITGPTINVYHEVKSDDDYYVLRGELINRSLNDFQPVTISHLYTQPNVRLSPLVADKGKGTIRSHDPDLVSIDLAPDGLVACYPMDIQVPALLSRSTYSFRIVFVGGSADDYEDDFPMRIEINSPDNTFHYPFVLHYKQTLDFQYKLSLA